MARGPVTQKQLAGWILGSALTITAAAYAFGNSVVDRAEQESLKAESRLEKRLDRIESKLDRLLEAR